MICVNDGATDRTEEVIRSFESKFQSKGMMLICINRPHEGQAAAVNAGLKLCKGKYLSWVDCDDFLLPDSIERKVKALELHQKYGIATSDFFVVDENNIGNLSTSYGKNFGNLNFQTNQFYLALIGLSIIESNCHLVRASCFDQVNPGREINTCREGQNYQLMLPLYYFCKRLYIDKPLACYVIRKDSHYHQKRTAAQISERKAALLTMLRDILARLGLPDCEIRRCVKMSIFNSENGDC
jgi:glycosyltransferase involved in cell wall biosynthesis